MNPQPSNQDRKVLLASPRGFCAGVVRAIDIVNLALERFGQPIYVRREIVHNKYVVNELSEKGTIFVDELDEVPSGSRVIFSAHGVAPDVRRKAAERRLKVIDATCPLVTKVHLEATKYARQNCTIILIGHEEHDEVVGTKGEAPENIKVLSSVEDVENLAVPDPEKVAYITQTTLSLDDTRSIVQKLREKYPAIQGPPSADICYATQNRQHAVLELARRAQIILVVGSANSSNSRRLVEVSSSAGIPAYLIDTCDDIELEWLEGHNIVGVTAGASAPEELVGNVLHFLKEVGYPEVEIVWTVEENVEFALPPELTSGNPAEN